MSHSLKCHDDCSLYIREIVEPALCVLVRAVKLGSVYLHVLQPFDVVGGDFGAADGFLDIVAFSKLFVHAIVYECRDVVLGEGGLDELFDSSME